jgi:hypothetical protein
MSTRVAGTSHWILTQGCGFVPPGTGIWKGQPATVVVSERTATGAFARTRVLLGTIVA